MKALILLLSIMSVDGEPKPLYVEVSQPGESMDQFAERIAPRARDTTAEYGHEICGSFQTRGEQFRIQFSTSGSYWGCAIDFVAFEDWKPTRLTMHTHTDGGGQGFSAQDNAHKLQGYVVSARAMTKRIGNRERTITLPR